MPGRGTTDTIFIVRQFQEACIRKNWNLVFAFVDLEKSFDRITTMFSFMKSEYT